MPDSTSSTTTEERLTRVHMSLRRTPIVELAFSTMHFQALSRFLAPHGFTFPPPDESHPVQHIGLDPALIDIDRLEQLVLDYADSQEALDAIRANA